MCLDQAGASADWDLVTAYWARYFTLPEGQRQIFDQAQQDWLNSLNQKCPRARNPRECVLTAYHRRAAAYRSQLVGDALAESSLTPEQHAKIQQSLIAFGFLEGEADGEFGSITRSAIRGLKAQSGDVQGEFLTANQRQELLQGQLPGRSSDTAQGDTRPIWPSPPPPIQAQRPLTAPAPTGPTIWPSPPIPTQPPLTAPAPTGPTIWPSPPPPPRIDTVRLKEARIFLEDTKIFISQQRSVPAISEIAEEAANLQMALNQFDERGTVESKQKLDTLLRPIPGFTEFEQQQQTDRNREEARRLAEIRSAWISWRC